MVSGHSEDSSLPLNDKRGQFKFLFFQLEYIEQGDSDVISAFPNHFRRLSGEVFPMYPRLLLAGAR